MQKKFLFISLFILMFLNCNLFTESDAEILSFTIEGSVGDVMIDSNSKNISVTVEPMDISQVTPEITLSTGAALTSSPALKDGEAVIYEVTAADGTVTEWKVTVTVQFGMRFEYGDKKVVYTAGTIDSTDAEKNRKAGDGVPAIIFRDGPPANMEGMAFPNNFDMGTAVGLPDKFSQLGITGNSPGAYTAGNGHFIGFASTDEPIQVEDVDNKCVITLLSVGSVGDAVTGSFAGKGHELPADIEHANFKGFFKLLRMEDNLQF